MAVALPHLRELPHSLTARVGGFGDPPAGETAAEDDGSWGTLHWAARWGDPSTLQMAFEYGADLNVQTDCGDTPLHISAWGGREMVVKELIARGADPFVINKEGKAALDVACSEQIRFLLRDAGEALVKKRRNQRQQERLPWELKSKNLDSNPWLSSRLQEARTRRGVDTANGMRPTPPGTPGRAGVTMVGGARSGGRTLRGVRPPTSMAPPRGPGFMRSLDATVKQRIKQRLQPKKPAPPVVDDSPAALEADLWMDMDTSPTTTFGMLSSEMQGLSSKEPLFNPTERQARFGGQTHRSDGVPAVPECADIHDEVETVKVRERDAKVMSGEAFQYRTEEVEILDEAHHLLKNNNEKKLKAMVAELSDDAVYEHPSSDRVALSEVGLAPFKALLQSEDDSVRDAAARALNVLELNEMRMLVPELKAIYTGDGVNVRPNVTALAELKVLETTMTSVDLPAVMNAISENSVTTVTLCRRNLGAAEAILLANSLQNNISLTRLALPNNSLGDDGVASIMSCLRGSGGHVSMTELNLSANGIGNAGAVSLSDAIVSGKVMPALTSLIISSNDIGDEGGSSLMLARVTTQLKLLNIAHNDLTDATSDKVAHALGLPESSLTSLNLSSNEFTAAAGKSLALTLEHNVVLSHLDLSGNNLGNAGASAVAESLKRNRGLRTLNLQAASIGPSGAEVLGQLLQWNPRLEQLMLSYNNLGDEGAVALSTSLRPESQSFERQYQSIRTLQLSGNGIGTTGADHLASTLEVFTDSTLCSLDLGNNKFPYESVVLLGRAVRANATLRCVHVSASVMPADRVRSLTLAMQGAEPEYEGVDHKKEALKYCAEPRSFSTEPELEDGSVERHPDFDICSLRK